jgi:DNA helicase HerA-like ATPase
VSLLNELPEEARKLDRAATVANELANRLQVVRVNDPLFGGSAQAADPGVLLSPPVGKRARVSVISLIGLPEMEQRQSFVNQLQMALFSWIKRHPARDRPLGGLFVMDEAQDLAPSTGTTACTVSTLRLVAQARKYGLGLLFATQAPKGLHNWIPGNSTTQLFGLLNSPAQISAAKELAKVKGGDIPDISRLSAGQFYLATEGSAFRQIRTPMCLSYHSSPLTEEEVIRRARLA